MTSFTKIVLPLCFVSLFVFGELAVGQIWRNPNATARSKDIYYEGVKLGVDTPLHILKEALDAEPVINQRTGDMDLTIMYAAQFYHAQCQLLGYNGVPKNEKEGDEKLWELLGFVLVGFENMQRWTGVYWGPPGRNQRITFPPSGNVSFDDLMAKYIDGVRKNAEQGDAAAQFKLGMYHALAMGVPNNPRESVKWIRQAADRENAGAQYILATYYAGGYGGLSVSKTESLKWLRLAAKNGDEMAEMWMEGMEAVQMFRSDSGNTRSGTGNPSRGLRLTRGDVILEINGERIGRQEDVTSAIARSPQTMYLTVRDSRTGQTARYVTTLRANRPRFGMTHQTNPGGGSKVTGVNWDAPLIYPVQ